MWDLATLSKWWNSDVSLGTAASCKPWARIDQRYYFESWVCKVLSIHNSMRWILTFPSHKRENLRPRAESSLALVGGMALKVEWSLNLGGEF